MDKAEAGKDKAYESRNGHLIQSLVDDKGYHGSQENSYNDGSGLGCRHAVPHHTGIFNHLSNLRIILVKSGGLHRGLQVSKA